MASSQSQMEVNSENNHSVSSVLQMFREKQNEAQGRGSSPKEVNPRTHHIKTPPTSDVKNNNAGRVGMLPTNENVAPSPKDGEQKPTESGRINLATHAEFLQDLGSATHLPKPTATGSSNEKKLNEVPSLEQSKLRTEPRPRPTNTATSGLGPSARGAHSHQPSHINVREVTGKSAAGDSAATKSPNFQGQSSNLQLHEHKINSPTEEQKGAFSSVVLQQKCSGKNFKKINVDSPASRLPASPKATVPSHINLFHIRLQYQRAVHSLKEELQVSAPNNSEHDDCEYMDTAPVVPPRKSETTLKSRPISIIPDLSAEEEAKLLYEDGFTPLPVCVPDDELYVDAVTEQKVGTMKVDQLNVKKQIQAQEAADKKRKEKEKADAKKKEEKEKKRERERRAEKTQG